MKRVLGLMLPLLLVAACTTEDDDTAASVASFTSGYSLGTQVVLTGKTTSTTKTYVEFDGTVSQVDDLDNNTIVPNTNAACQTRTDKQSTVIAKEVTGVTKTRIAGRQKAWILPGNYGTAPGENGTNVWGDPSYGWLFVTEPNLNILLSIQSAGSGDNRHLSQYLKTNPVNLFVFETDNDLDSKTMTTTSTLTVTSNQLTIDETTAGGYDRSLSTFGRYDLDGFVWQTTNLNNLYQGAPVNFNSSLVVPSNVKVGDTWVNNNGSLMSAVGVDVIEANGVKVPALHVIERGATDTDLTATGVSKWCVSYYSDFKDNTTERKNAEVTDLCDGPTGTGVDQVGTGWINLRHTWYYKGLAVKIEQETSDVSVAEYGYATPNTNGTVPGAPDNGNVAGTCARYYTQSPMLTTAQSSAFKPYAIYSVTKTHEVWEASDIKKNYTIAQEYKESKTAAK